MNIYNIHTHKITANRSECDEVSILNTYPHEFYSKRTDSSHVWYSCGIHPWYIKDIDSDIVLLEKIIKDDRVVAVGEAGLDKLHGPDMNIQIEVFRKQIQLAEEYCKPLIIHCVKAWDELIALFKEYRTDVPWIIHGYRGNTVQTKQLNKMGFKFSIGEKFNEDSLKYISLQSLFCETDMSDNSICQVYTEVSVNLGVLNYQFADIIEDNIGKNFKILTK